MPEKSTVDSTIITKPRSASKSDATTINKLIDWLREAETSDSEKNWRTVAKEDYNFYAGKQDTAEVTNALTAQKRPITVFNMILPKVNMLVGLAAQMNRAPYVFPRGNEDQAFVELANGTLKFYRNRLKVKRKEQDCFSHTIKSGKSYLHYFVSMENPFKPEIKCMRIDGRNTWKDPLSVEYDMSDARYFFVDKWFSEEDIKARWPKFDADSIKLFSQSNTDLPKFYDSVTDKYRITECWYRKYIRVTYFLNPLTGKEDELLEKDFKKFEQALMEGINVEGKDIKIDQPLKSFTSPVKKVFYTIFSANYLIEEDISPYKHGQIPYIQFGCFTDEDENRWFGVITMAKDPQRGLNTMRRQLQHLLQTAPKGILMHEVGAIIDIDQYEQDSSNPTYHMEVAQGMLEKIKFTDQPQISPVYGQLDAVYNQAIKDIMGIQDSLLGMQTSSREPGITVRMRQESGLAVLFIMFDNYRESRINSSYQLMSLIQQYMTEEQVIRIEGPEGMQLLQMNTQMNPQLQGFNDLSAAEFDYVLDEATDNATIRMAIMQMLIDYGQQNPGTIPPDVIMEYGDLPISVQVKIKQYQEMMMKREDERLAMGIAAKTEGVGKTKPTPKQGGEK